MSTVAATLKKTVKLSNGEEMPQVQLGLYMMSNSEARLSVSTALRIGYRGFDCAQMYGNEEAAGDAIRGFLDRQETAGLSRENIFYTSKLAENSSSYDDVRLSIKQSVAACGLGYIDLFLLHSPYGGKTARLTSWQAVEDAIDAGEIRSGGVSNYGVKHIEELVAAARIQPVVNQIEVHPFNTQTGIRDICRRYNIVVQAYAPLVRGMRMRHPVIKKISTKYNGSPPQLLLRWSLQHGMVLLPKSTHEDRMVQNANLGEFEISDEDMKALDALDEHLVTDWDPTTAR